MSDFAILAPIEIEAMTGFKIATRQLAVLRAPISPACATRSAPQAGRRTLRSRAGRLLPRC